MKQGDCTCETQHRAQLEDLFDRAQDVARIAAEQAARRQGQRHGQQSAAHQAGGGRRPGDGREGEDRKGQSCEDQGGQNLGPGEASGRRTSTLTASTWSEPSSWERTLVVIQVSEEASPRPIGLP